MMKTSTLLFAGAGKCSKVRAGVVRHRSRWTTALAAAVLCGGFANMAHANTPVPLQNATSTFYQGADIAPGRWAPGNTIDGVISGAFTSWAVIEDTPDPAEAQTIVWETQSDVGSSSGTRFRFQLYQQDFVPLPGHNLGHLRLSYTTDNRSQFADGIGVGGDVSTNWTPIDLQTFASNEGDIFTKLPDLSVLVSGGANNYANYTFEATLNVAGITGFRLEALEDPSLPFDGPGRYPLNGNFHVSEFVVTAVPEPSEVLLLLAGMGVIGAWHARRQRRQS